MNQDSNATFKSFGSKALDEMVSKLQRTMDPKRKYEYVLWLSKKLPGFDPERFPKSVRVKGCVSQVHIYAELINEKLQWYGYSDALITRGLLALLINGLSGLSPEEVLAIDPGFIAETGLQVSLTPSRANGFMNILLTMKSLANDIKTAQA
ncbi:SufE family protein [Prochlorococcus sp. MIT 1341]|uniref:SufE family protein n=1 Tax=Prochlorococcus sp. MIT 1341 TaxID=3096221 RepID=UPI002A755072|nr:SufE family protein [Prochlorococcus sp. MIT 1341]